MNIIGISALFHDAACCVLVSGELIAAAQEERFSRVKSDPRLPIQAFKFCLRQAKLDLSAIDCIGYYENPFKKLSRQLWMAYPKVPSAETVCRLDPWRAEIEIRDLLGFHGPIEYVDHHRSHAASAYYFSGMEEAAILTVDGVGEWATTTYGYGDGDGIRTLEEVYFPDSIGLLYSTITSYLGFSVNEGEYKVMGLAPYGQPVYKKQVYQLIESGPRGQYRLNMTYFDYLQLQRMYSSRLTELFGYPPREPESQISQFHQDVACSVQRVVEELLLEKVRYLHEQTDSENLCMAGGVALNCVANSRILRNSPFRRLFVQPAANDAGGCLGAAVVSQMRLTGRGVPVREMVDVFLGPEFTSFEIAALLDAAKICAADFRTREPALLAKVVDYLIAGDVVGWFQGRMEFGPRSLGSRSILADPRLASIRAHVNELVKKREGFRPFAPAVLESSALQHFDLDHPSRFMLETCQVRSPFDLPAITHVDGSARVQTVTEDTSPRFARLLAEFGRRTGCPILLNTSFNVRGEPIVCTPADALNCFITSGLDVLVLGDFIIRREALPASSIDIGELLPPAPRVSNDVYTFV